MAQLNGLGVDCWVQKESRALALVAACRVTHCANQLQLLCTVPIYLHHLALQLSPYRLRPSLSLCIRLSRTPTTSPLFVTRVAGPAKQQPESRLACRDPCYCFWGASPDSLDSPGLDSLVGTRRTQHHQAHPFSTLVHLCPPQAPNPILVPRRRILRWGKRRRQKVQPPAHSPQHSCCVL
jgi:hypothetical protein